MIDFKDSYTIKPYANAYDYENLKTFMLWIATPNDDITFIHGKLLTMNSNQEWLNKCSSVLQIRGDKKFGFQFQLLKRDLNGKLKPNVVYYGWDRAKIRIENPNIVIPLNADKNFNNTVNGYITTEDEMVDEIYNNFLKFKKEMNM